MDLTPEEVRQVLPEATREEAAALAEWYAGLRRAVSDFPVGDLKRIEPPLRSTPGPA